MEYFIERFHIIFPTIQNEISSHILFIVSSHFFCFIRSSFKFFLFFMNKKFLEMFFLRNRKAFMIFLYCIYTRKFYSFKILYINKSFVLNTFFYKSSLRFCMYKKHEIFAKGKWDLRWIVTGVINSLLYTNANWKLKQSSEELTYPRGGKSLISSNVTNENSIDTILLSKLLWMI